MNSLKFMITTIFIMSGSAYAYPTHFFSCNVGNRAGYSGQSFGFAIEENDISNGRGQVRLSRFFQNSVKWIKPKDCGMADGCMQYVEWDSKNILDIPAHAKIRWGTNRGHRVITGVELDLGSKGKIQAFITKPMDQYDFSKFGKLFSNVGDFYYPRGIDINFCNYFLGLAPKPGLTGSN